jgi:hypothetical protein
MASPATSFSPRLWCAFTLLVVMASMTILSTVEAVNAAVRHNSSQRNHQLLTKSTKNLQDRNFEQYSSRNPYGTHNDKHRSTGDNYSHHSGTSGSSINSIQDRNFEQYSSRNPYGTHNDKHQSAGDNYSHRRGSSGSRETDAERPRR